MKLYFPLDNDVNEEQTGFLRIPHHFDKNHFFS